MVVLVLLVGTLAPGACAGPDTPPADTGPAREDGAPVGRATTGGAEAGPRAPDAVPTPSSLRRIVFLGTSLTAGYGLSDGMDQAYPSLVQERIEAAGLPFLVDNEGVSGETSAGGLRRVEWLLREPIDVLVIELGANDGLRALDVDAMRTNLDQIIERTKARYPGAAVVVLGIEAPPNLGPDYAREFRDVFREVADRYDAAYLPFLLAGVAGVPNLNQADGIHPTAEGHRLMADLVWQVLEPVLRSRAEASGH